MRLTTIVLALSVTLASACLPGELEEYPHDQLTGDPDAPGGGGKLDAPGLTVDQATWSFCSTSAVSGLSRQLIEEIECLRPGTIARIDDLPGVSLFPGTQPFLQAAAVDSLRRAAAVTSVQLSSGMRTLAQQYMLFTWYDQRLCTNVVSLAAPPGESNHESGLAIDVLNYGAARSALSARGFRWLGGSDPVHFDYVAGGTDLRGLSILAFQRLYNRNNPPSRRIAEDGDFGYQTETAMRESPAAGFAGGASCNPPLGSAGFAIEVYWARQPDGHYELRALAPQDVASVEYRVDGYRIGSASRAADGANFPTSYEFAQEGTARTFEVIGYDANGTVNGRGVGLIDVTSGTAVYIKQMGAGLYEIGLERAPAAVAAVEVRVDGFLLTDGVSNQTRSSRNAVRSLFSQLGPRTFQITTFNSDGSPRGNLFRAMTME